MAYWPTLWTQSLVTTLPKKGNLQLCQNYRTISLISHPNKVMLKVILNRLKPRQENIIAEEQAGFRAGMSTTEQIFNLCILYEKYLPRQQDLYHVFTMMTYNINPVPFNTIQQQHCHECSSCKRKQGRLFQNNSWCETRLPAITNTVQYLLRENHD